jgi:rfaE bifunctional protein kinase chain/domain
MLTTAALEAILTRIPELCIGVLGDLFLDRYLEIDAGLTEPSLETGLDAYQVVRIRAQPGAAGTVLSNLAAFGTGQVLPIAVIGDDGEGYELRQALARQPGVEQRWVLATADSRRRTPTYTKPLLHRPGLPAQELNRLDIKNRQPLPRDLEDQVLHGLRTIWPTIDALLVLDQVSEPDCGVVTTRVRQLLQELGAADPAKLILADSRERIGLFRAVALKPNRQECLRAVHASAADDDASVAAQALARLTGRPVFCTLGELGMLLAQPTEAKTQRIPSFPVRGPVDIVGAGDSSSAAIACAVAAGADLETAAAFGNLVASITIQQLGTTGTAPPAEIRRRWQELSSGTTPPRADAAGAGGG